MNHVVQLTPTGRGAVAVVLVTGAGSAELVDRFFQAARGRHVSELPLDRIFFGCWYSTDNDLGEELVICRRGDDVEVHCHGGAACTSAVTAALVSAGAVSLSWDEWLARSVADRIEAAARIDLARAPTQRTAAILLDQMRGALREELGRVIAALQTEQLDQASEMLQRLLGTRSLGEHLVTPWKVAIAGRPNAGKSSLVNAMLGYQRAIVYATPGTTRDVVTAITAVDGWPIELADTAGIRQASDAVEQAGVELARQQTKNADLTILVWDRSGPWTDEDAALLQAFPNVLVVHHKCDLPAGDTSGPAGLEVSSVTGSGLPELMSSLANTLVPIPLAAGEACLFRDEFREVVRKAQACVERGDATGAVKQLDMPVRGLAYAEPYQPET
jgi:tRNA modification GTPase